MAENEKSFTAEEVNKIVAERLSRQKKNDDALEELKAILLELKKDGKLGSGSVAELAKELIGMAQKNDDEEKQAAEHEEDSSENTAQDDSEKAKQLAAEEKFANEIAELSEAHPELDVSSLINDEEFGKFYAALAGDIPELNLLTAYEAFSEAKAIEKRMKTASSMKRTPVMQSAGRDFSQNLTERQRNIAKHAGMSYKEYAELLSEIPKRKLR